MRCGSCGTENRAGRRFCSACGSPLVVTCAACGSANEPADRFCGACGAALGEAAAPAPPGATGAERRLVSVLFADLVGFTMLSEHRDPEEVRELLSLYFDRCRVLIERYGGVVEKFIGDAVMAVWGTPVAREDDAERAVRAALALTQAVTALGDEVGMPGLRARAGVLTGSAAVEVGAEGEGMVLGDTVNTASRLQSIAGPGTVLVDDVTRSASEAAIVYEEAGTHHVKGRDAPVPAWTALRVVAGVGGARRSSGLEAPFVGRDAELAAVIAACEATATTRAARRVTVLGDAGAGKSRLLWEFFKHMDGLQADYWWHQGRALSYGEGVGYWPLAEMVRTRAGILEEEDPAAARAKLAGAVAHHIADERERRLVEPRLAHLLGLEQRTASDRADLFSGWRLFFERMAATGPVILAFEDLQWADPSLLDFIDYLLEWSAEFPIFVLALARPELASIRPAWRPELVLGRLGDAEMRALLDGLVPGLPDELAGRILAQADGVPLYAVETVRMLLDRGLLAQQGARYVVTGDVGRLAVPETLHALIASRLDGLDPDERGLLQLAAVYGQTFPLGVVVALSGRGADEVRQRLEDLVDKQVLAYDDDPRSPERGQYRFLQGLLRTIAYGTLSRRDRKAHHLAVARHLQETAEAGELAEVLASHFLEAARAEPGAADAPRIRASARETLAEAGRRALSLALGREAQRAFDRAAELAEDDATRAELLEQAGRAAWLEADAPAARERLDAAVALYEAAGSSRGWASANLAITDVILESGDLAAAVETGARAYAALEDDDADRAAAAAQLGRLQTLAVDFDQALALADHALEIAEPMQRWDILADALITRGSVVGWKGRFEECRALLGRAIDLAIEHDDAVAAWRGCNNLAWGEHLQDRLELAAGLSERAIEVARARGDLVRLRHSQRGLASLRGELGDWDAAEAEAATFAPDGVERALDAELYPILAQIRAARGAHAALAEVMELARGGRDAVDSQVRDVSEIAFALALAARGGGVEALQLLEAAMQSSLTPFRALAILTRLEVARELGRDDVIVSTLAWIGGLSAVEATPTIRAHADRFAGLTAESPAEAERLLLRAASALQASGRPFERAKVLLDLGERRGEDGRDALAEARAILARLRATPWLERADRVLRGVAA